MTYMTLTERLAFAKRLDWLVKTHGSTIKQFCLDMELERKTFYGWRAGAFGPTAKTLTRLAHKGVDLNWLLTGKSLRTGKGQVDKAEAQLDQAMELLRQVQRWLQRGGTSSVAGRIDRFLAEQQLCQRCGGEGRVAKPDAPGIRTRWYEDCPDCKLKEAMSDD